MARLDLEGAPPTWLPRVALALAAAWGLVAGMLLLVDGRLATVSRWSPAALALVHSVTVGLFGNAATGALLQFLPAAAGVRTRGGPRTGLALLAMLNLGAIALVAGFHAMQPDWLVGGGVLVAAALSGLAAVTLPGLLPHVRDASQRGLAMALFALLATAAFGLAMLGDLLVHRGLAPARWIDVHAGWGLGGVALLLLASIAQTVLPMFQGVAPMAPRRFGAWLALLAVALVLMSLTHAALPARVLLGACVAAWALSTLWRQARTRTHARNPVLVNGWRAACIALLIVPVAGFAGDARLAGAFALALALPLAIVPMLLEITAFVAWLGLHRKVGGRVPGVHALQPERDKARVVALHGLAGVAVVLAVASSDDAAARIAGAALLVAHGSLLHGLLRLESRARRAARQAAPHRRVRHA